MTFKYKKTRCISHFLNFPWEDLLFVNWWRLNAASGRGQCVSQSEEAGPSIVHRDRRHSSYPRSPSGHSIPQEDVSGTHWAGVSERIVLYLQFAAQDDCEMCVGAYFITYTPGYEECVSSLIWHQWFTNGGMKLKKMVSGLFCFGGKTMLNNENYYSS